MKQKNEENMKNTSIYIMCLWAAVCVAACSGDDDAPAWPGDGAPLELYAVVQDYAGTRGNAAGRATTDGTWKGGEQVTIHVHDSVSIQYTDGYIGVNGKLINSDHWRKGFWEKYIYAQYPWDSPKKIQQDQRNEGYQNSDYMLAPQKRITISSPDKTLVFRHLPAKVVVHLKAGNGVIEQDIRGATVTFENLNRTWGDFRNIYEGTIDQVSPAGDCIFPNEVLPAAEGYTRTVRALFVPQNMSELKLLKIVIGSKTFYYTAAAGEADFFSGRLYEYRLTVTSVGVTNSTVEGGTWLPAD